MKVTLIGYRGTGKTAVGKKLAAALNRKFVDTDDLVEARDGRMISEIFAQRGEPYFRELERGVIAELKGEGDTVISAGGGAVMDDENIRNLKHKGCIVLLTASPETILKRVQGTGRSAQQRPALTKLTPLDEIRHMLAKRKLHYESAADLIVDTDQNSIAQAVEKIVGYLRKQGAG